MTDRGFFMNCLRVALISLLLVYVGSCFGPPAVERTENEYEVKKANDENRDEVIKRTARTIRGDTEKCEDKNKSHDCYEYCKDMYRSRGDRGDCEELTVAQVEALWDLYELLKNPDAEDLSGVDKDVFDLYLNVSIRSLDSLIKKYNSRDAKEFLMWLIENEDIAKIFEKEDDDHKSLEALLKKFSGSYSSNDHGISEPFLKRLDGDKLIEKAVESELILDWFQEYINNKNSACKSDTETRACFAVYCKIGKGMDDDARDDWLNHDDFEEYIEEIIDEKVNSRQGTGNNRNASGWIHEDAAGSNSNEIGDVGDLDDWVDDLCQGLIGGTVSGGGGDNSGNNNQQPPESKTPPPESKTPPPESKTPPPESKTPPPESECSPACSSNQRCINRWCFDRCVPGTARSKAAENRRGVCDISCGTDDDPGFSDGFRCVVCPPEKPKWDTATDSCINTCPPERPHHWIDRNECMTTPR